MISWQDILKLTKEANPPAPRAIHFSLEEWKKRLSPELYAVAWQHKTQAPSSAPYCPSFPAGLFVCSCCDALLFDTSNKYESHSGWPSFTQPIHRWAIRYKMDYQLSSPRVEVSCNTCGAHLGHVFPDGPAPSKLRFCINEVSITSKDRSIYVGSIVLGGGCFWCTEAIFKQVIGVISVESGYAGGETPNPTYQAICTGKTDYAEVIRITYDRKCLSYRDLVRIHLLTHDPTTLNRQGNDIGTQYRSIIFYNDPEEEADAKATIRQTTEVYDLPIVTEVHAAMPFYPAEAYHQDYFANNPENAYCQHIISPKLQKARKVIQKLFNRSIDPT